MSDCGCGCQDCSDTMNWPIRFAVASRLCSATQNVGALQVTVKRTGQVIGCLFVSIVRDNQGIPSTRPEDEVFRSDPQPLDSMPTDTDVTVEVPVGKAVDPSFAYHVVVSTDDEYRASSQGSAWIKSTPKTVSPCAFDGSHWGNTSLGPVVKVLEGGS